MHLHKPLLGLSLGVEVVRAAACASTPLVFSPGQVAAIPSWDLQSSASAPTDLAALSQPGADTAKWHHINISRCTVMGCLLADGTYKDSELFFSDKLGSFDRKPYTVPWIYRNEFALAPATGQHFFLHTNGITSRADLYLNGKKIADKTVQSGAYGGQTYDITSTVGQNNALVVNAYPTQYWYDFGLGFVDWNPYPADNGTGVWRNITIKQTGPVALGPLRVTTDFKVTGGSGTVTLKALAQNLESSDITVTANGLVSRDSGDSPKTTTQSVTLKAGQTSEITLTATVDSPAIWWPKQWGDQPLYKATLSVSAKDVVSDTASKAFGFRQVTSSVNKDTDVIFTVNGKPFQVLGGGYTSDMFLRWDEAKVTSMAQYMLDMGHNTFRLEGKMEHPELYELADRLGLMILPGWECCDKWESWSYNTDLPANPPATWTDNDYQTANASMRHEAAMMQNHPSVLGFLVGSDVWPDDRATGIYLTALKDMGWQMPIIASAAKKGYPKALGPGGMKMEGPYDWVPPNYWYDTEPAADRYGAAFGFGSEQSPGGGTPELSSLKKFLTQADLDDLWKNPKKGLYHQSTVESSFHTRTIFNNALWARHGAPTSLDDYLMKTQIMDYEASRSEFEGFAAMWSAKRPATGLIYWMLNGAWPSLHWQLFDYYLHPAGAYFGAKIGGRVEHVAYDYVKKSVWLINRSLSASGSRTVKMEAIGLDGKSLVNTTSKVDSTPNTSKNVGAVTGLTVKDVAFLKLTLADDKGATISRNVYWLASTIDSLNWEDSEWYYTPVKTYANFKGLDKLAAATVSTTATKGAGDKTTVVLENKSTVPAFFISLNLVDKDGADVNPVLWSDNYVTLWPQEKLELQVSQLGGSKGASIQIVGKNVAKATVTL